MPNILTAGEGARALRCDETDQLMLDLLEQVDAYILRATGRSWGADTPVEPSAKAAARMLLVLWHSDPGMMAVDAGALGFGSRACLTQLEALAQRWTVFEGTAGTGIITLPGAKAGDTVSTLVGKVGISGDQRASFESVISYDGYIQQLDTADLTDKFFQVLLIPAEAV